MNNSQERTNRPDGRPRVAYLTNMLLDWETQTPRYGGGESYSVTLGRLLRDLGFEVTFFQAGNTAFEGEYYGFRVIAIPHGEHVSEFQSGICNVFYHLTRDYDHVIHNIPTYASGLLRDDALVICHSIWFDHENYIPPIEFRTPRWFEELYRAFSRPRRTVCVDTNVINVIRALWPELTARMTYIPSYVDTGVFRPPERRDNEKLTVLFPRRAEYTRGSRLLEPILDRVPHDCRFLWVGDGEPNDRALIESLAARDSRLEFYAAAFEEMPDFYKQADICVIPAVASEGTSLASLEALASGCAVVATNVGGLANIFQPGVNGLLTDVNADQLAAAINRLIEDPDERARLQAAGPRTAEHFSLKVWRRRWAQLLNQLGWVDDSALALVDEAAPADRTSSASVSVASLTEELSAQRAVLSGVVAELSEISRQVDALWAELGGHAPDGESIAHSLQALKARFQKQTSGLKRQAEEMERQQAEMARRRAEEMVKRQADELVRQQYEQLIKRQTEELFKKQIGELVKHHTQDLAAKDHIIASRDEGIAWLRSEVAGLQREAEMLRKEIKHVAGLNQVLNEQLADREAARQSLQGQLKAAEAELDRIKRSLGWRLLSRYGKIKYRYLLPIYSLFGAAPSIDPTEPPVTPPSIAGGAPDLGEKIDQFVRESQDLLAEAQAEAEPAREEIDTYSSLTLLPHLREDQSRLVFLDPPPKRGRPDVICFAIIDWDFRYQRPQQIMSQFAANGHRVFYVSPSRFAPNDAAPRVVVSKIKENVYGVQLAALRQPDIYGEVIGGEDCEALLESLKELRRTFKIDDAIGHVMIASWGEVALRSRDLWGWRIIYDCMDEWENFPGIKPSLLEMERRLVHECDLVAVTARRLLEKWKPLGRPIVLVRNGVDFDFYAARCKPNDLLTDVKHPVVGYYGAIADWFDIELMEEVARRRPDYTFVLLGGVFDVDVSGLEALPNVRLLGQQPYELMPEYLYHFDACIIPFKLNSITQATDPVKVYEYLSGGRPVVSVALEELDYCRDYVHIAEDAEDFLARLDEAVAEDDPEAAERRREFARQQTWQSRYETISEGLASVTPTASIIVVTYNNLALNKLCLESIIRNTEYPNYEIIVVDNASQDGTPPYLRYMAARHRNIRVILNRENRGFAAANNQGLARATGDYLVLLNNDTVVPPGWLSRLLRHLRHAEVGLVGSVTNFVGNEAKITVPYQTLGEMEDFARQYTWEHDGQVADIHMLAMFCVALRRDTYEAVGPLDEQFGIGMFEDDDYSQRVKAKGYRVICAADVFVHHFGQAAFKKLIEKGEYDALFEQNRRRYEAKWNVKWIPHKHESLDFRPIVTGAKHGQATKEMRKRHGGK